MSLSTFGSIQQKMQKFVSSISNEYLSLWQKGNRMFAFSYSTNCSASRIHI